MSDEVISIEEVIAYSLDTFPGLIEAWNWGERSLFYNPDRWLPKGTYFLTFKERDGANDSASRLRPGDYRLNIGISKAAFTDRFGAVPARPAAGGVVRSGHDFGQRDRILPHPVYGWMCWIAIVNPTHETFEDVKPLLSGAYERAVERHRSRMGQPAPGAAFWRVHAARGKPQVLFNLSPTANQPDDSHLRTFSSRAAGAAPAERGSL